MIRIVTWLWGNKDPHPKKKIHFTHEHVNRLASMVSRNISIPYEMVCITDNPEGIDNSIRCVELWDDLRDMGGCYTRLKAFSKEMKYIIGPRFMWLDLDTVIVDDITPLIDNKNDFMMWGDTAPRTPYNGSMVLMDAGARSEVWTSFDRRNSPIQGKRLGHVGTDQAWIGACLGPNEKRWTKEDGVYSFRVHFKRHNRIDLYKGARIVFFHGSSDPSQPEIQNAYPWVKHHWR
ncbi:MAG: hypothetical protein ABFD50_08065 [Smithella sp.]